MGSKTQFSSKISHATGIKGSILRGGDTRTASIACRMSWAAKRETTRKEDEAYCLLGIFGISMPLLYGEGKRAFIRLQEEIMKGNEDQCGTSGMARFAAAAQSFRSNAYRVGIAANA